MRSELKESIRTYRSDQSRKGGKIEKGDTIKFSHVDIVSPEGKLLVHGIKSNDPPHHLKI